MMKLRLFVFALLLPLLTPSLMMNAQTTDDPLLVAGVSRELAAQRAAQISDVRYQLGLELMPGAPRLKGRAVISFKLANATQPVVLDFRDLDQRGQLIASTISNVTGNSQPVNDLRQVNGHLVLPARYFNAGANTITLGFASGIAPASRPIIRYQDQEDGSEYVYTLFVPMDASLAFPCFDQPDLKARFQLTINVPDAWQVISNGLRSDERARRAGFTSYSFDETPPISTYLFAFAAGPFERLRDKMIVDRDRRARPFQLYVRKSQLARAQEHAEEIFAVTRAGWRHLTDYFAQPFPFSKYDQVLLPGFAYGGMEHAGATFLREDAILFRTVPTRSDKLGRAALILHELAHQWFGDLVTMRWFDDLWLKEGFANFMAYHALAAIYEPNEMWQRFYQAHKPLAYNIDATKGTTPIYQEVRNLRDAKSAYGAIVYQKAPSLLRALSFVIGEDSFRNGVQLFLREHAYANAEWNDLIKAFERASQQNLTAWAETWVKRRGMPQVDAEWSCDARGLVDRFELRQRDVLAEGGVWPVKTQLLLAYDDAPPQRITTQLNDPRQTLRHAIGQKCPAYVFANEGDYGYGRFMLDARSRAAVMTRLGKINDSFLRTMLWGALWDAVREAELKPQDYLQLVLKSLPEEKDEELTQSLLDRATRAFRRYLAPAQQRALAPQLEVLCFERMTKAADLGLRITYFRAFRALATTEAARQQLKDILAGKLVVPGVEIKPQDRWRIITALLAQQDPAAETLLAAERQRDTSDDARKQAYIAEAARADAATKRRYFADYLSSAPAQRPVAEDWIEGSLSSFNWLNQSSLTLPYLKPALAALPRVKRERKIFFVLAWLNAFIGGQTSQAALAEVQAFLHTNKLDRDLELKVLEVVDELARTVRIRAR